MAKSVANKKTVTTSTLEGVTLTLSLFEAYALLCVLSRVGGSPGSSPRGYVEHIHDSLQATLPRMSDNLDTELIDERNRAVYFENETRGKFDEFVRSKFNCSAS